MSNNTLPSAWLPIDASAAGVSVFASEQWITPSKHQNPFDRRWVHHEQLTSLQQNLSLQSLNHEKAASVAGAAASVACVRQLQEFSNETWILWLSLRVPLRTPSTAIRNLDSNCWQWFTMSQFNHICLTFSKPKPKLQPRSNVTVWCLGSSGSLLRCLCLCLSEGTSTFQRDRMTTMASLKNTTAYTWEKWIPRSVFICGCLWLFCTCFNITALICYSGLSWCSRCFGGLSNTLLKRVLCAHKLPKDVSCHSKVTV